MHPDSSHCFPLPKNRNLNVKLSNSQFRCSIKRRRGNSRNGESNGGPGIEPLWVPLNKANRSRLPQAQLAEISDQGSLTQKLTRASQGDFLVELMFQGLRRPLFSERRILGLKDRQLALVREVKLICKGEACVVARSIIPLSTLTGKTRRLAYLGNKPLGGVLFKDPSLKRTLFEISVLNPSQLPDFNWGKQGENRFWGRRSIFNISNRQLLVSEIFLPNCPKL